MLLSNSFIPILKNNPSEAKIKSHQLMLRVGMIKQSSAVEIEIDEKQTFIFQN